MTAFSFLVSYCLWFLWTQLGELPPAGLYLSFVVNTGVKALIWLSPAVVFLLRRDEKWLIPPRALFSAPFPWLPTLIGVCGTVVFLHTARLILVGSGTWGIFQPMYILMALAAAVIEELAFRGFLFNRQAADWGTKYAAPLNGLLFAVYHFPEFLAGQNLGALLGFRFWMILGMGCIFSIAFARWKHLGMVIGIHFVWNLLCYWFALV